jgi:hypothetical protein
MGKLKGFKTITFNALALVAAVAEQMGYLPAVDPTLVTGVTIIGNVVLRLVTKSPVFSGK